MKEVSVGIIRRNGLVLACQRKRTAQYPLQWEFPGGKIEKGETPSVALIRELEEELGIEATPGPEYHRQEWDYGDMSFRVFYFPVDTFRGEPVNRAFESMRWVKPEELQGMNILAGNRDVVHKLMTERR
jgi:8-oxo-dGTP diphosphatase